MKLENIKENILIRGVVPGQIAKVVRVRWFGADAIELTYKDEANNLGEEVLYREDEQRMESVSEDLRFDFGADPDLYKLACEAGRIRLAHLFDPLFAVHTSDVQPLPHQLTAVYETMLPRHPLRFLLADDPGAGKTVMTGLLLKELIVRGDVRRCLIVCPGSLVEQWQDEMFRKFGLAFDIMTNDQLETARTGNWFFEHPFAICRLDKLSRNEEVQAKLAAVDWDFIVCDEAHKMSASLWGKKIEETKRYKLGKRLETLTRHFLLLTATPHNGKIADFQLFMSLLDPDRFEGRFRSEGPNSAPTEVDVSDLMRRMVKEELLKFDGTRLFPERRAYTVDYELSPGEAELYQDVTQYVRKEFNRADALDKARRGNVGFALTILQRRLASSPEAIYQSLTRRRERLEKICREEEEKKLSPDAMRRSLAGAFLSTEYESWDDEGDLEDDTPSSEIEDEEEKIVDKASAAQTIVELKLEIETLKKLEAKAEKLCRSGTDRKWDELSQLLQDNPEMFHASGHRRKLIVFTEHRDTLNYLKERIEALLGRDDAVVVIHGGLKRQARKDAEQSFTQDKTVEILIATDAAGEGINLQRAHLMVNYDLPWNPNRLEQRFGRIHRIGQTEVCHCWNLVAAQTREGEVYQRLLAKLETERAALGGKVFDILGSVTFDGRPLRELLLEAIRYGESLETKQRLNEVVDRSLGHERLRELLDLYALTHDTMNLSQVRAIRDEMERAETRRLQPHFISAFFREAFARFGGSLREREQGRYEIRSVPLELRSHEGKGQGYDYKVLRTYERVTFEKSLREVPGKPLAALLTPGHPLLDVTIDLVTEKFRPLLREGCILVDENDLSDRLRVLVTVDHSILEGRTDTEGRRRIVSQRLHFVEIDQTGTVTAAGCAPYLDYRAPTAEESEQIRRHGFPDWLEADLEQRAVSYAVSHLVAEHLKEIRARIERQVDKTLRAVQERLTAEINYWDAQAILLREKEENDLSTRNMTSKKAKERADDLQARLKRRQTELALERQISPQSPTPVGMVLVVPAGWLKTLANPNENNDFTPLSLPSEILDPEKIEDTKAAKLAKDRIEAIGMQTVMEIERSFGFQPVDVSAKKCGYDIESTDSGKEEHRLRFIEVKGRFHEATSVTVTSNEIRSALNSPEQSILAVVLVAPNGSTETWYIRNAFEKEPDFIASSVNYPLNKLFEKGVKV